MIATLTESLLPGLRSLRAPLFAGIGWTVLLWLVFADQISELTTTAGWAKQALDVVQWVGPVGASTIAVIAVFIVGAVATTVTEAVSRLLGIALGSVAAAIDGQRDLRLARAQLIRNLEQAGAETVAMAGQDSHVADAVRASRSELELRASRFRGWRGLPRRVWIRRSVRNLAALEPELASGGIEVDLEKQAIITLRSQAIREELLSQDPRVSVQLVEHRQLWLSDEVIGLSRDLRRELGEDPLDSLRVIDDSLFNDLDRERSERQVRLALSFPIAGFAVFFALHEAVIVGAVSGAFSLIMMLRYSAGHGGERARILNMLMLRGTPTPSMKAAYQSGQLDARMQAETVK